MLILFNRRKSMDYQREDKICCMPGCKESGVELYGRGDNNKPSGKVYCTKHWDELGEYFADANAKLRSFEETNIFNEKNLDAPYNDDIYDVDVESHVDVVDYLKGER
jgi:hypothetical protein